MHHPVAVPVRLASCHAHDTCGHPQAYSDHQPEADCVANGDRRGVGRTHPNHDL